MTETTTGAQHPARPPVEAAVDTEAHLFLRAWPNGTSELVTTVHPYTRAEHDGDLLVAEMDRAGVAVAIVVGYDGYDFEAFMERFGSGPGDFMGGRGYTKVSVARHPDRLRYVTTLRDPRRYPYALHELEAELGAGAAGVKIFPSYLRSQADSPEIRTAVALAGESGARVVFGFEDTAPPETPSLQEMYEGIARLASDHPHIGIQLNHGGNVDPRSAEARLLGEIVAAHPNILVSTSVLGGVMMDWPDEWRYPFPTYLTNLGILLELLPEEQVAWGSDWPWFEGYYKYPQILQAISENVTFSSDEHRQGYFGANARRHWGFEP